MRIRRIGKRIAALLFCLLLELWGPCFLLSSYAELSWPSADLTAVSAALMDADTGAMLFEKNGEQRMYPASITKVMTALVVLKHANLEDQVSFSHDAVYNVDYGSSNAQIDEGDVLTVSDCLHALLLKSANEAANALAEHVAGSREKFAEMMNEEAAALGCSSTHFSNPSGLFSEDHYTTAHDMALIGQAAFRDKRFLDIEKEKSYTLKGCRRNPEGITIYMEHKMLLQNSPYYDERVVAGKTGFTKDAGNTLLTLAQSGKRRLIAVVLGDKTPYHYSDTRALFDLGFGQTENQPLAEGIFDRSAVREKLLKDTIVDENCRDSDLHIEGEQLVSLPGGASQEGMSWQLQYNMPKNAPEKAVARIQYFLEQHLVGEYFIEKDPSIRLLFENAPSSTKAAVAVVTISGFSVLIGALVLLFGGGAAVTAKGIHDDRKLSKRMKERRRQRLSELKLSEEEFRNLVARRKEEKRRGEGSSVRRAEEAAPGVFFGEEKNSGGESAGKAGGEADESG